MRVRLDLQFFAWSDPDLEKSFRLEPDPESLREYSVNSKFNGNKYILYYSVLFYSILFYSILFYSILFYFILLKVNTVQ